MQHLMKLLCEDYLLSLPLVGKDYRKRDFAPEVNKRHLWYGHVAKTLGWRERRTFLEHIANTLQFEVWPTTTFHGEAIAVGGKQLVVGGEKYRGASRGNTHGGAI